MGYTSLHSHNTILQRINQIKIYFKDIFIAGNAWITSL